jgi:hypothetical protein
MGTVANLIEEARYDLVDYQEGLEFDDRLLFVYVNRMIQLMDSQLNALDSDLMHGNENLIAPVQYEDYVDLTYLNNGYWDSIKEVWIGTDRKQEITYELMNYKRQWRENQTAEPEYWALFGKTIQWEADCNSAHDDLLIRYRKTHRKRLESWSDTFSANATTDVLTLASGNATFVTGDGPFQVTTSDTLPTGISASTNYWVIFDPADPDGLRLATTKEKALNEKEYRAGYKLKLNKTYKILERETLDFTAHGATGNDTGLYFTCNTDETGELEDGDRVLMTESLNLTGTGVGTQTLTLQDDVMPYDGAFDQFIKDMLVLHALSKRGSDQVQQGMFNMSVFKKRAMEEVIRRGFVPKYYYIDY